MEFPYHQVKGAAGQAGRAATCTGGRGESGTGLNWPSGFPILFRLGRGGVKSWACPPLSATSVNRPSASSHLLPSTPLQTPSTPLLPHPRPTCRGLDHDREADALGVGHRVGVVADEALGAGHRGHAGVLGAGERVVSGRAAAWENAWTRGVGCPARRRTATAQRAWYRIPAGYCPRTPCRHRIPRHTPHVHTSSHAFGPHPRVGEYLSPPLASPKLTFSPVLPQLVPSRPPPPSHPAPNTLNTHLHGVTGSALVAHEADLLRLGADELQAVVGADLDELGALRQEAVALGADTGTDRGRGRGRTGVPSEAGAARTDRSAVVRWS